MSCAIASESKTRSRAGLRSMSSKKPPSRINAALTASTITDLFSLEVRMDLRDVKVGILRALAPFDDKRRTDQLQGFGEGGEVGFAVAGQLGLRTGQRFIEHDERLVLLFLLSVGQCVAQHEIGAIK